MTLREYIILDNKDLLMEDKNSMMAALAAILLGITSGTIGTAVKMNKLQDIVKPQMGIERVINEFGLNAIVNFLSLIGAGASAGMAIQAFAAGKARHKLRKSEEENEKAFENNTVLKKEIENLEKRIYLLTISETESKNAKATIETLSREINRLYIKYPAEQLEGQQFSKQTQSRVRSFLNKLRGKK
jgi:hypothetical protein